MSNIVNVLYFLLCCVFFCGLDCSQCAQYYDKYIYVISRCGLFGCNDLCVKSTKKDVQFFNRDYASWTTETTIRNGIGLIHMRSKSLPSDIVIKSQKTNCIKNCLKYSLDEIKINVSSEACSFNKNINDNKKLITTLYRDEGNDNYLMIISNMIYKSVMTGSSDIIELCQKCRHHQAAAYCYCFNYVDCNLDKNSYKEFVSGNDTDDAQSTLEYQDNVNDPQNIVNLDDAQSV